MIIFLPQSFRYSAQPLYDLRRSPLSQSALPPQALGGGPSIEDALQRFLQARCTLFGCIAEGRQVPGTSRWLVSLASA